MKLNPCCIPLKTGVRMITHMSMALALAVGWTALKLISISSEVTSTLNEEGYNQFNNERQPLPKDSMETYQDPYFRIPYEYILYYNWHQHQQQMQRQLQQRGYDDEWLRRYYLAHPPVDRGGLLGQISGPYPYPNRPQPEPQPPLHPDEDLNLFRSVLRHRKNFKGESGSDLEVHPTPDERGQLPSDLTTKGSNMNINTEQPVALELSTQDERRSMMMRKPNSQRDTGKKRLTDFRQQYAKLLLVCGLLALCTVVFQFLTSFLLLCFVDKGSNAAAQIWTAVNCSVIFCLATCLVLFLCEGMTMAKYSFDETLYLSLVTLDSLLAIYFLWVVMAFI